MFVGLTTWVVVGRALRPVEGIRAQVAEISVEAGVVRVHRVVCAVDCGQVINPDWTLFSFPTRWYYDVLRALDHFRSARSDPDERFAEAIGLVVQKRQPDGRWLLENPHTGDEHFDMEPGAGQPSRWITLRALRVLRWADRSSA